MSESEFLTLAGKELDRIEAAVEAAADAADADIEISRTGNVMELEFENGSKIIINSQAPTCRSCGSQRARGGFHYRRDGERWVDTRSGSELYAALSGFSASKRKSLALKLG
ncbi:iron donor protein CyaY [Cupriavidus basilensis]